MAAGFYQNLQPVNLPVPKGHVMQLIQYALREDAQIDRLTQLICVNPALSAQLLGLVNSSFFGFRQPMKTIFFRCLCKLMANLSDVVHLMNNEFCETSVRGNPPGHSLFPEKQPVIPLYRRVYRRAAENRHSRYPW